MARLFYNSFHPIKIYGFFGLLIISWWTLAFRQKPYEVNYIKETGQHCCSEIISPIVTSNLPFLQRDQLKSALAGDFSLMTQLIADWDIDAQILEADGIEGIKRLSNHDFLNSQYLGRMLKDTPQKGELLKRAQRQEKQNLDSRDRLYDSQQSLQHFLPQTYASASFLLALISPYEIVALPRRLREQTQLYPKMLTDLIPLDIDRYNAEKLFQARPGVAFVAQYSHPATIQALSNQGISLYMTKNLHTLHDIADELLNIGRIVHRPFEAELLKIFMEAAIIAIDNRLTIFTKDFVNRQAATPKILFLNYHQHFSIPTLKTLTGHLLEKIGIWDISLKYVEENEPSGAWTIPIDKEHILNLNPDCLIIAAINEKEVKNKIRNDKALSQLKAIRNNHLYFVDEAIQQSPSQYIVLAYHDLIQVLANLP